MGHINPSLVGLPDEKQLEWFGIFLIVSEILSVLYTKQIKPASRHPKAYVMPFSFARYPADLLLLLREVMVEAEEQPITCSSH